MEDDVVTKPNYMISIEEFVEKQKSTNWLILEFRFAKPVIFDPFFSSLGFIGKLFRSTDLSLFIQYTFMFYKEKPVDWMVKLIFDAKYCDFSKKCPKV